MFCVSKLARYDHFGGMLKIADSAKQLTQETVHT